MNVPRLILASASPRRAELLREMGLKFHVVPSDAAEAHNEQLTARELCQLNAYRKARAVAKRIPDALVLGADTLVYLGTRLFGKPASLAEAERMLERLQGRTHQVATGICLVHLRQFRQTMFAETTSSCQSEFVKAPGSRTAAANTPTAIAASRAVRFRTACCGQPGCTSLTSQP